VTRSPRRITLYWLLLLLPTLAVGAGALLLLHRERARLDEQARAVAGTRTAAIAARARLIAENVELLIGDVERGFMSTLRDIPAANPEAALDEWERANPLVRVTFRVGRDARVLRPSAGVKSDAARAWLPAWIATAPWRSEPEAKKQLAEQPAAQQLRKDIASNVSGVQNARDELKEVASQRSRAEKSAAAPALAAAPERSGWGPWRDADRLHLIGWRQLATGGVLGVEVDLNAIGSRLGELLPQESDLADAFAVRETGGETLQRKTYGLDSVARVGRAAPPSVTVPLAASVLPGWEVVGFARDNGESGSGGGGFFLVGALLVAIFVAAILAGGSLLLWQARRSEAEAAQKTSFVANVSHEFKTPLTTIRLYAELLETGRVRDAAQGGEYLRTIGRETQRLARLVNNALDFSRLEQGRKKFAREPLDLAAELARLLDTHAPRVAEAGLALQRELPAAPVAVTTDRDAVGQIVLNLLDNACKYAAAGGEVRVSLMPRAAGGAEVHVADRGPGVPASHDQLIFEKFHRIDDLLTAEQSGAGLGLSIARQLARGLGGELRCTARPGGGADFVLELP
jgi:signal transduction histidine kinase